MSATGATLVDAGTAVAASDAAPGIEALERLVAAEIQRDAPADVRALADAIRARHGDAAMGVLYYGSLLRARDHEGVHDFYLLVDGYRRSYRSNPDRRGRPRGTMRSMLLAIANRALPPNVFYLELARDNRVLRTKYAVISLADFHRATGANYRHTMIWARFSQPFLLIGARDDAARRAVRECAARSIVTLVSRIVPLLPAVARGRSFAPGEFWQRAYRETYRAELRTETGDRALELYESARGRYDRALVAALRVLAARGRLRVALEGNRVRVTMRRRTIWLARASWPVRRRASKLLAVGGLLKSSLTFGDWLPYVLWKLRRHTGVVIEPTPRQRRHPLIFGWPVIFGLLARRDLK